MARSRCLSSRLFVSAVAGLVLLCANPASAQLKDETPAERDAQILRTLLPGTYSNGEQVYFDGRLNLPAGDRSALRKVSFTSIVLAGGGQSTLVMRQSGLGLIYVPTLDQGPLTVRLSAFRLGADVSDELLATRTLAQLERLPVCDLNSRREAGQFRAIASSNCTLGPQELMISERAIWWRGANESAFARLNRARAFDCYVDMPGSGGIRGETFHRFDGLKVDDQGTEAWFTTRETTPRRLGLRLRAVDWAMNNKAGTYTRDSLTLYLVEAKDGGETQNLTYAWTEPNVRRIGLNTIAILANCFMDGPTTAKPEF
jgi:hypothetical protein